jgi:aspartyl-tRNA(Asn)/glutamyl-tRNA(Gln) amidotransferase subunit A
MNAFDIAAAVAARRLSAKETAVDTLQRIEAAASLNALVTTDPERTLADAESVDRRIRAGEVLPLAGTPVVVKDNIWVAGWRITQGSRLFEHFTAPQDAIAVARLKAAGAVVVGIGASSEFACKGVTTSPLFGPTRHPLDPDLTPGGSSGGPSVAVAAGLVPIAIGTDAGGSIRRPAAHVGAVGFKPSFGAIPYGPGFAEPANGISVIGPIARDVRDTALTFDAMAGRDPRDPDAVDVDAATRDSAGLRVAFSPRLGLDAAVDQVVADGVAAAVERLRQSGLTVQDRDPVWPAGLSEEALMPLQHAGLAALYGPAFREDPIRFDRDIAAQIERGLSWRGVEVAAASVVSDQIARAMAAFFVDIDILLTPTVPCVAWPLTQLGPAMIGGRTAGPRGHAVFTPFINHARVPAISIPCGRDSQGLPFGLQIIAARNMDRTLLQVAAFAERALGF